jgi:hypothetical protein
MKIKIHNDGKEKWMSFEASLDLDTVYGWGENEQEALEELKNKLTVIATEINKCISGNIEIEYVDGLRNPLK